MKTKHLRVDLISIFPEMLEPYLTGSILGRAQKAKLLDLRTHNLRQWTHDAHQSVDDRPFGGGPGMVMKVAPFHEALVALKVRTKDGKTLRQTRGKKTRVILTSAKGKTFTQQDARRLAKYDRLVFLCGRYEGVDERVADYLADEELSIGNYVLTGGELAALVMTDAVARLRPGVLGKEASLDMESHDIEGVLEYPHYTRPERYPLSKTKSWNVPAILLSGDHAKINTWRKSKQ
ncbi:MAG TPA: tRNA (guanosine(37)-N1)-methyltransferase TrmD [Patescibacteria group bacterium]|nr:tRNA (guanosine(37)-N1)-methyltransferase TrmD [Patescibacteria group bacterium]